VLWIFVIGVIGSLWEWCAWWCTSVQDFPWIFRLTIHVRIHKVPRCEQIDGHFPKTATSETTMKFFGVTILFLLSLVASPVV
jgi:hypothetical protein